MVTSATDNFVILTGLARLRLSPSVTDPPWPEKRPACPEAAHRSRWRGSRYLPQQPTTERKGFHARKRNKRNVLDFLRLAPGPMGPPAQMAGVCPQGFQTPSRRLPSSEDQRFAACWLTTLGQLWCPRSCLLSPGPDSHVACDSLPKGKVDLIPNATKQNGLQGTHRGRRCGARTAHPGPGCRWRHAEGRSSSSRRHKPVPRGAAATPHGAV